jgi:hypothetical protein
MNKTNEKKWSKPVPVALPITEEELASLGLKPEDHRGELKTYGPWGIPVSYRTLAMSTVYSPEGKRVYTAEQDETTAYGIRTMTNVHQSGYEIEGHTSVHGKKYRSFSSSQLFELPDGRLIDIAIIHVCIK